MTFVDILELADGKMHTVARIFADGRIVGDQRILNGVNLIDPSTRQKPMDGDGLFRAINRSFGGKTFTDIRPGG